MLWTVGCRTRPVCCCWSFRHPQRFVAGAAGAEASESLSYGAVLSAAYAIGPNLMLGLGTGIFERLDQSEVFPFVVIDWKINDRLRLVYLANPNSPSGTVL